MKKFLPEGGLINTAENKAAIASAAGLREALYSGTVLEARAILCDKEHNLHIELPCMKGIIKREDAAIGIDDGSVNDIAIISRVNKAVAFKVLGFHTQEDCSQTAVLSRKAVQLGCLSQYIASLRPGDVINARVTHMEGFGAFLDIGAGISALMPIDSISISRIPHPSARLKIGQEIRCVIKSIDELGRISLSLRELLGTWEQNAEVISAGETVPGIVRSIEKYGIFVELAPNLAGLAEHSEGVEAGDHASVYIKSIIPERMKIKLIIIDPFSAEYPIPELKYFTDAEHIDHWLYSPQGSSKVIETIF